MRRLLIITVGSVLLAGCTSSATPRDSASSVPGPDPVESYIVCHGTPSQITRDLPTLRARVRPMSGTVERVHGGVRLTLDDAWSRPSLAALCGTADLELRPLLAPTVHVTCAGSACSATPLASIASLPTTGAQYQALPRTTRNAVARGLARTDCSGAAALPTKDDAPAVACDDPATGPTSAYLLGPAVVTGPGVRSAHAVRQQSGGAWSVDVHLDDTAAATWQQWTTGHDTGGVTPSAGTQECGSDGVPCSDFVGITVDGTVVSAPVTEGPIGADIAISSAFTQRDAELLAAQLRLGALPVGLRVGPRTHH